MNTGVDKSWHKSTSEGICVRRATLFTISKNMEQTIRGDSERDRGQFLKLLPVNAAMFVLSSGQRIAPNRRVGDFLTQQYRMRTGGLCVLDVQTPSSR